MKVETSPGEACTRIREVIDIKPGQTTQDMNRLLLSVLLGMASVVSAGATIIATVDTATELSGTFSFSGIAFDSFSPVGFAGNLPGTAVSQILNGSRTPFKGAIGASLSSDAPGTPDDVALARRRVCRAWGSDFFVRVVQ